MFTTWLAYGNGEYPLFLLLLLLLFEASKAASMVSFINKGTNSYSLSFKTTICMYDSK